VFIILEKENAPTKWKRLLSETQQKPPNMGIWWEMFEKYEKELEEFENEQSDDEYEADLEDPTVGEEGEGDQPVS
jgi:hypothetical protein